VCVRNTCVSWEGDLCEDKKAPSNLTHPTTLEQATRVTALQPHLQLFICALTSLLLRTRPWITVGSGASPPPPPPPPPPPAPPASAPVGSAAMAPGAGRLTVVKQMLYSCRDRTEQVQCGTGEDIACLWRAKWWRLLYHAGSHMLRRWCIIISVAGWLAGCCGPAHGCSIALIDPSNLGCSPDMGSYGS
jgi:hypothetical protein